MHPNRSGRVGARYVHRHGNMSVLWLPGLL